MMGVADKIQRICVAPLVEKLRCASRTPDKDSPDPPCESCLYADPDAMFPGEYVCDSNLIMQDAADVLEDKQRETFALRKALARTEGKNEPCPNRSRRKADNG